MGPRSSVFLLLTLVSGCASGIKVRGPLARAIWDDDSAKVAAAIKHGADPNKAMGPNDGEWVLSGESPLMLASRWMHVAAAKALLDAGADVKYQDAKGESALTVAVPYAMHKKGEEIAILFLEHGAPIPGKGGDLLAKSLPSPTLTRLLLDKGADPNAAAKFGTPLSECGDRLRDYTTLPAFYQNVLESCRLLVTHGGEPESAIAFHERAAKSYKSQGVAAGYEEKSAAQLRNNLLEFSRNYKRELQRPKLERAEKAGDEALAKGDRAGALLGYGEALKATSSGSEDDRRLRGKAFKAAAGMTPPPDLPEEAERRLVRAEAFIKKASGIEDFASARKELEAAALLAPWAARTYYNLGLVDQKLQDYPASMANFNLYLLAAPDAPDAPAVKKRLIELEVDSERLKR